MKNKLLMLIPLFALTACGTKVSKLGTFGLDRSAVWEDNYYTYFDNDLLEVENTKVTLDKDTHKVFTSYTDANFLLLEERASGDNKLSYYDDFDEENGYGPVMKLSHHNNYIREGVVSKLFNGQLFCHGYFEKARVQIKESGFSSDFGKKLVSSDYLYLQFKSSLDFKSAPVEGHEDDLTINISFYNAKQSITYSYSLKDIPTNIDQYIFFGFSTKELDLINATHFSITYKVDRESYNIEKGLNVAHALLLYEFGFKNPVFK